MTACRFLFLQAQETDPFTALPEPVMAFHKATTANECSYDRRIGEMIASVHDVGHGWRVYIVPCLLGAYQGYYAIYAAKGDNIEISRMPFVTWEDGEVAATNQLAEAEYDPKTRVLASRYLARGLGDCGTSARYAVTADEYEVQIKVIEIRHKTDCDGKYVVSPKSFRLMAGAHTRGGSVLGSRARRVKGRFARA